VPTRKFILPATPEKVFPGSELDGIRQYHDDIELSVTDDGIQVIVPETIDPDTADDVIFHITEVQGFTEIC
jgi:hypothetical protein